MVPSDTASTHPRVKMIASQLVARGITDAGVLHAMLEVPREPFIPEAERGASYDDGPQPVACGQTISQPYIVARMLELLGLRPGDRVLEVGTGTGYQAAVLAQLGAQVVTIERHATLAEQARANLAMLGLQRVDVRVGDGTRGALDRGPFDAIIVAAAGPRVAPTLVAQLAPGGRMVCPVGDRDGGQRLVRVQRSASGDAITREDLDPVRFVPLIGDEGWAADQAR